MDKSIDNNIFCIYYKYCPLVLRYTLLLDWQNINYKRIEIFTKEQLTEIFQSLWPDNFLYIEKMFYGSMMIIDNKIININGLLAYILSKNKNSSTFIDLINKETWIENNLLFNGYYLTTGNNIINIFNKISWLSERQYIGNQLLIDNFGLLNIWFKDNPWINNDFSYSDFSAFIILKGIFEKNINLLRKFPNLENWYYRMNAKKNWIDILNK